MIFPVPVQQTRLAARCRRGCCSVPLNRFRFVFCFVFCFVLFCLCDAAAPGELRNGRARRVRQSRAGTGTRRSLR